MRLLILGGTGFVGAHLLRECTTRGDELWATYRPGEASPPGGAVRWLPVDVLDGDSIREALAASRAEGVVHLAGQANVAAANRDPLGTFRINAEGTLRVLSALRERAPDARAIVV